MRGRCGPSSSQTCTSAATGGSDLLRRADLREPLLEALADVDRFVILGDGLELREAAHRDAMDVAAPFFADVGEALGPDKELIMLAGNHDHGIAAGWIDARLQSEPAGFLGLEQRFAPGQAGPLAAAARRGRAARRGCNSPTPASGCATTSTRSTATTPTCTRRSRRSSGWRPGRWRATSPGCPTQRRHRRRLRGRPRPALRLAARADAARRPHASSRAGGSASAGTYAQLTAKDRHKHPRTLALGAGYRAAVFALNRAGLGPLEASLSPSALRRGYLTGIREVIERLDIERRARHLGPLAPLRPVAERRPAEWTAATGARILNTGSWVYQPHFLSPEPNGSPYWPGTAVIVDDDGPPRARPPARRTRPRRAQAASPG